MNKLQESSNTPSLRGLRSKLWQSLSLNKPKIATPSTKARGGDSFASTLCLIGLFLYMILSDPLLHKIGINYSGDEGKFYEKIHPATFFIFLSFFLFLLKGGNIVRKIINIIEEHKEYSFLLFVYILIFFYMAIRSGFAGLAFLLDTHISAVLCAIILSHASCKRSNKALNLFIFLTIINSLIGIVEAGTQTRIFEFDPDWEVLKEEHFRASAFLGHPLNNAIFTSMALFITLSRDYNKIIKTFIITILFISLVAFGGRAALGFSILATAFISIIFIYKFLQSRRYTVQQIFLLIGAVIIAPVALAGILYLSLNSGIGERIAAHGGWDSSADTRILAFKSFNYMSSEELFFGISPNRLSDIIYRMSLKFNLLDIENPWIIMLMFTGGLIFPIWLIATFAFIYRLLKDNPLAIKMVVIAYFIIGSTYDSFGRKDANYPIMVCVVICAALANQKKKPDSFSTNG